MPAKLDNLTEALLKLLELRNKVCNSERFINIDAYSDDMKLVEIYGLTQEILDGYSKENGVFIKTHDDSLQRYDFLIHQVDISSCNGYGPNKVEIRAVGYEKTESFGT